MITKKTIQFLMSFADPYYLRPDDYKRFKRTTVADMMQELIVLIKYICFDRECIRRENAYLRRLLDKKTHRASPKDEEDYDG